MQSLGRAFAILETMADAGGIIGLSQLSEKADLPLATIHRLIRTLVDLGYVRQEASRQYSLGPRLMRLANTSSKRIGTWAGPAMNAAVAKLGESVNLAVLDGDEIVYVAQSQAANNFMRMFTEVGRRTRPHATAVGKAILAERPDVEVLALLERTGMPRHTEQTLTKPAEFLDALAQDPLPRLRPGRGRAGTGSALRRHGHPRCTPADGTVDVRSAATDERRGDRAGGSHPPRRRRRDRCRAQPLQEHTRKLEPRSIHIPRQRSPQIAADPPEGGCHGPPDPPSQTAPPCVTGPLRPVACRGVPDTAFWVSR